MFLMLMIGWWYSHGFNWIINGILKKVEEINEIFSVRILVKTLFAPWKQIQTTQTFQNFLQSSVDNFISRFIGATVRISMLIAAFFLIFCVIIFGLATIIIWPFLPILVIGLPILSLLKVGI